MTRRQTFVLRAIALFGVCVALVLLAAYTQGVDPFHPRSRHIWLISLITAFYAAIRLAMILDTLLSWRARAKDDGTPRMFGFLKKTEHAIDQRMAERRARVAATKEKSKPTGTDTLEDTADV